MPYRTIDRPLIVSQCSSSELYSRYFVSQAKEVLPDCESSHIALVHGKSEDEEFILLLPISSRTRVSTSDTSVYQPIQRFTRLEPGWTACVIRWCKLWRNITKIALTILVGSLALLQLPGTSTDPLTRCFVFLFILRFVPALISARILLYYFSKEHFRSGNFVIIWYQNVERYRQLSPCMPWTILALPAIAFAWGVIFILVAVFLSVLGDGLYHNLSSAEEISPLMITSLRVTIIAMSVFDFGWVSWLVVRLRALDKAVKAEPASTA